MRYNGKERSLLSDFLYFLDCQLATVSGLAMKKSSTKCDRSRQARIAGKMIASLYLHGVRSDRLPKNHRAVEMFKTVENDLRGDLDEKAFCVVMDWADRWREEMHPGRAKT